MNSKSFEDEERAYQEARAAEYLLKLGPAFAELIRLHQQRALFFMPTKGTA